MAASVDNYLAILLPSSECTYNPHEPLGSKGSQNEAFPGDLLAHLRGGSFCSAGNFVGGVCLTKKNDNASACTERRHRGAADTPLCRTEKERSWSRRIRAHQAGVGKHRPLAHAAPVFVRRARIGRLRGRSGHPHGHGGPLVGQPRRRTQYGGRYSSSYRMGVRENQDS